MMDIMGICGDDCSHCPRYLATQKGGKEDLEKVRELWVRLELREPGFPAEEMACHGCMPENNCAYSGLRQCVRKRKIENCGFCAEYPCDLINTAFEKSENLKSRAGTVCTDEEMALLEKSFFSKKEFFDRVHKEHMKED